MGWIIATVVGAIASGAALVWVLDRIERWIEAGADL